MAIISNNNKSDLLLLELPEPLLLWVILLWRDVEAHSALRGGVMREWSGKEQIQTVPVTTADGVSTGTVHCHSI